MMRGMTHDERSPLRALREAAGYQLAADFARAADMTTSAISAYETGRAKPTDEKARILADTLGVSEVTVRRAVGLWVPEDDPAMGDDERHAMIRRLTQAAEDLLVEARRIGEQDEQRGA